MLKTDTLKRIRQLELKTRRLVNTSFAGAYHSAFKGRGMAFEGVRPYQPGDDIRDIDWNVTARTNETYVKYFKEERELTVMLLLDSSASCLFGTQKRQKRAVAAEIGAALALSAIANNDQVGLLIFSDQVEHFTAPRKGQNHILRLIRDLLIANPTNPGTDLATGLHAVNRMLKQRAIIFLISDFLATSAEYVRELNITARRHDLIAVILSDPLESQWNDSGLVRLYDAETHETILVDTSSANWRKNFHIQSKRFQKMRDMTLSKAGVDRIDLSVKSDYITALKQFFQKRERKR